MYHVDLLMKHKLREQPIDTLGGGRILLFPTFSAKVGFGGFVDICIYKKLNKKNVCFQVTADKQVLLCEHHRNAVAVT